MSDLVFITGGSGHIGYQVVLHALQAGYRVRAAVRSKDKIEKILLAPSIKALGILDDKDSRLQFVEVPDLSVEDAYDEAIKGTQYAIHVASPITSSYKEGEDLATQFLKPALVGTMNLLKAAQKAGSIRRVVITSSVAAITPSVAFVTGTGDEIYNERSRVQRSSGPFSTPGQAYAAGKAGALNEAEAWVRSENPSFDIIHIFPGYVIGPNELVTDIKDASSGTNALVLGPVLGRDAGQRPSISIHVNDVASAHVLALNPQIDANENPGFVLSSEGLQGTSWDRSLQIARQYFPKEVQDGLLPANGTIESLTVKLDASQTERVLGLRLTPFEEQVKDLLTHYVQLARGKAN